LSSLNRPPCMTYNYKWTAWTSCSCLERQPSANRRTGATMLTWAITTGSILKKDFRNMNSYIELLSISRPTFSAPSCHSKKAPKQHYIMSFGYVYLIRQSGNPLLTKILLFIQCASGNQLKISVNKSAIWEVYLR
jgi:hypothetical protein